LRALQIPASYIYKGASEKETEEVESLKSRENGKFASVILVLALLGALALLGSATVASAQEEYVPPAPPPKPFDWGIVLVGVAIAILVIVLILIALGKA